MLIILALNFRFQKVVSAQISWLLNTIVEFQHEHRIVIINGPFKIKHIQTHMHTQLHFVIRVEEPVRK